MKVSSNNYYEIISTIGIENLSPAMKKAHELIDKATKGGTDWKAYQTFRKAFDLQFQALELSQHQKPKAETTQETVKPSSSKKARPPKIPIREKARIPFVEERKEAKVKGKDVELISPEVAFIKRFAALNHKTKTKEQVMAFIRSLQKAIVERKIRKTSKFAAVIATIQKQLVSVYQTMGKQVPFEFSDTDYHRYLKMVGSEVLMPSIRFIKAFITMKGREVTKEKAKALHTRIVNAIEKKVVSTSDPYFSHIKVILNALADYVKQPSKKVMSVTEAQLSGLEGVLKSCGCQHKPLTGLGHVPVVKAHLPVPHSEATPRNTILSSQQVLDLKSHKLNFNGKWLHFIGNPSRGFTAMIFGRPKFGKSYLAMDFAGYLARNHGKVLYVSHEEGFEDTLKQKLEEKGVSHPNLFVSDYLPESLSNYSYVFIDSVNNADLSSEDLDRLEQTNPFINFIYIFQVAKNGTARGTNEYMHNVDIVIEVPEKGKAVQFGRFNQGGEMNIFE